MKANRHFPSLDRSSMFEYGADFDPTTVITRQFLDFLQLSDLTEVA